MIKSENMGYLLDKDIRKVFIMSYKSVPNRIKALYSIEKSSVATEKLAGVGDMTSIGEFTGKIAYNDIVQEDELSISHTEYAGGLQIRRKIMDDDQHRVIKMLPKQLGERMGYRRQQDGAGVLNNAFSSGYTYLDGGALCASSHNAASSTTTWDNTGTEVFSPANISAVRLLMRKITSPANNIISIIPNLVVIPIDKEDKAIEIFKSTKEPYTANNTLNINAGRMDYIAWEFLTSTTAWFMLAKSLMADNLVWFNRTPTEFNKDVDTDTYIKKWSSYMRYSRSAVDFRFLYGCNATS